MAVIKDNVAGSLSGGEWITAIAFLGAIYCLALGVFKRFRASMTLGVTRVEQSSMSDSLPAVYRPFGGDVYSPSYRIIDEVSNGPSTSQHTIQSLNGSNTIQTAPKANIINHNANTLQASHNKNMNGMVGSQNHLNIANGPSTSQENSLKENKSEDKDKQKHKSSKDKSDQKTKSTKNNEDKDKKKSETDKKDKKEKSKNKKVKKDKSEKKVKDKGKAKETSKPVASVTIDEDAVASTQGVSLAPPPYTNEDVFAKNSSKIEAKNKLTNPIAIQSTPTADVQVETQGFTSSWDQVALHRQNIQRDNRNFKSEPTNIRGMMNQNRGENREINSLFIPSNNSPRNKAPIRRISPPSDYDSESDTEA